ncbi:MAG: NAD-dependent epimerase/dehydratase family protein [Burkholderiales bacterium]
MDAPVCLPPASVVVVGGTSQVGHFLLPRLAAAGYRVTAFTRGHPPVETAGARWVAAGGDTFRDALGQGGSADILIWLAPLPTLPPALDEFMHSGVRRIIAFGTTGRHYKNRSGTGAERDLALAMIAAEEELQRRTTGAGVALTLFRPTLVYGCGRDENITFIARTIRRFGFFPLVGGGRGLRQPVHADDLAEACVTALPTPATFGRAYDLSGGSTLTYCDMVTQVFVALGRRPRFVDVPLPALRLAIRAFRLLPRHRALSLDMADRMLRPLCFDHGEATRDFGYAPRPFAVDAQALYGDGRTTMTA